MKTFVINVLSIITHVLSSQLDDLMDKPTKYNREDTARRQNIL